MRRALFWEIRDQRDYMREIVTHGQPPLARAWMRASFPLGWPTSAVGTRSLGTVDASVVTCAERLGIDQVATLDHRHFGVVRPSHVAALTLLP